MSAILKVLLVDDEKNVTDKYKSYLEKFGNENNVEFAVTVLNVSNDVMKCDTFGDIVFLDIDMPGFNGLEVAEYIRSRDENCLIVFITNMPQYAINGYKVRAIDYMLKPISYQVFKLCLERALRNIVKRTGADIKIKVNYGYVLLNSEEILYVESVKHKVVYHLVGRDYETWGTLSEAEKQLENYGFVRCNSCYLVNLAYVESISLDYVSLVNSKEQLKISRQRKKEFLDALTRYTGR